MMDQGPLPFLKLCEFLSRKILYPLNLLNFISAVSMFESSDLTNSPCAGLDGSPRHFGQGGHSFNIVTVLYIKDKINISHLRSTIDSIARRHHQRTRYTYQMTTVVLNYRVPATH